MTSSLHTDLDLSASRPSEAPRAAIWKARTEPARFEQRWVPAPEICRVRDMDLRPGGAFRTEIGADGSELGPHIDGYFLAVDEFERIVFTDALLGGRRPAESSFMTRPLAELVESGVVA